MKKNSTANHGWWQGIKSGRVTTTLTVLLCLSALSVIARPRPITPFLPEHENYRQRFELFPTNRASTLFIPEFTTHNLYLRNVTRLDSWAGYSVALGGDQAPASYCYIPALSGPKRNFNPLEGSFRWYYAPGWSSGEGPGHRAVLIEVADVAETPACGWTLSINPQGTHLQIHAFAGDDPELLLSAPIQWEAGAFHQVGVVASASNNVFRLMVDGQVCAQSTGPGPMDQLVPMERWGLFVGSTGKGRHTAEGCFNELVTWSGQCTVAHYAWDFAQQSPRMDLGPITPEEDQSRRQRILARRAGINRTTLYTMDDSGPPSPLSFGGGGGGGTNSGWASFGPGPTNGLMLTIPIFGSNLLSTTISNGMTNVLYDLFMTTNLVYHPTNSQWTWVTNGYITDLFTLSNPPSPVVFFILGTTNDSDGGGFTDAFELLVSHTSTNNSADDQLVGLELVDGVAMNPPANNTATFRVKRLGNYPVWTNEALTVVVQASGSAIYGTDYTLSEITTNGTNLTVTIPANQASVDVVLTPLPDAVFDDTQTATLQIIAHCGRWQTATQATALILGYYDYKHIYTLDADFRSGVMSGLVTTNDTLQFSAQQQTQFPYIAVACSLRGTVARINTTNGMVIGEYRTTPIDRKHSPSRTTVDQYGNVWVANRDDDLHVNGTINGSVTRIGLIIGGTRYTKVDSNYIENPFGQYVSIASAVYNTCIDRDGDGFIRTSYGLTDILPWSNTNSTSTEVDTFGGVSTAEDEAITAYIRVPSAGTRTIAVDRHNDVWVGGYVNIPGISQPHCKINGVTGMIVPDSTFAPNAGGYGGVIDGGGNLWSTDLQGRVLYLTPPSIFPITGKDWTVLAPGANPYGIAVDPLHPYIWQTVNGYVFRWNTNGTMSMDTNDQYLFWHGEDYSQGLAVDSRGEGWIAHGYQESSQTVGHLDTNANWLGNVPLTVEGLRAEYYGTTNLVGIPIRVGLAGNLDYAWTNGWPAAPVPATNFSARWIGQIEPRDSGEHIFIVTADTNAIFTLSLNGSVLLDNWTYPNPTQTVWSSTIELTASNASDLRLEYVQAVGQPRLRLSWVEPGTTEETNPTNRFVQHGFGPTGVSVDAEGKIWAGNHDSHNVMRIDPNAGEEVVTNGQTYHVGAVDMVVDLGDGTTHTGEYTNAASPYNYSDMTGFNNRVVNPARLPLKAYWTVMDDGGINGAYWRAQWDAYVSAGSSIEVWVRANDDRLALARQKFVPASNGTSVPNTRGRFIELRLALIRESTNAFPVFSNLTLYASSSTFTGDGYLDDQMMTEGGEVTFEPVISGTEAYTYQWYAQYPWSGQFVALNGAHGTTLTLTNLDSWDDGTLIGVCVTNNYGEALWLGPAELWVVPQAITIPAINSGSSGPASRYPATIEVFGQPTNLVSAAITLDSLSHDHPEELNILLVSPAGTNILLLSDAGGYNRLTNATLVFHPASLGYNPPPYQADIPTGETSHYGPCNYGAVTQMTNAPAGPYSTNLENLTGTNPNGIWKLYIYDRRTGGIGVLHNSWRLQFFYQ